MLLRSNSSRLAQSNPCAAFRGSLGSVTGQSRTRSEASGLVGRAVAVRAL